MDLPPGKCAALEPTSADFILASIGTEDRRNPDTATASNGDSIVVWEALRSSFGTDSDRYAIHARLFAEDGTPKGPQFQVNTTTADEQRFPTVSTAPDGRFVIAWRSGKDTSGLKEVRARIFRANATPVATDFKVNTVAPNANRNSRQIYPRAAMASNGTVLVTWESDASFGGDQSDASIQGRLFNFQGAALGPQFQINSITPGAQERPNLSVAPNGTYVVVWQSLASGGSDNNSHSVQARRVGANGMPTGTQFQVNDFTQGSQSRPAVASGPGGQSLVVWQSRGSRGSDNDGESIQARAIAAGGGVTGPEFQVNQTITGAQLVPKVAAGLAGDFVVVWQSDSSPGNDQGTRSILARHIASPGRFFDVEFQVNTTIQSDQEFPAVSVGPNNAMVVFFSDSFGGALTFDSLGQVLEGVVSPNSLCLSQRRFLVQVEWETREGTTGEGAVVSGGSDDSGLFWFFNESNWEMLVKVLDACSFNGRFWVFAAATTDVQYELRVTDLFTGDQVEYSNPLGNAAAAITDTEAFAGCDAGSGVSTDDTAGAERSLRMVNASAPPAGLNTIPLLNEPEPDWLPSWTTTEEMSTTSSSLTGTVESQCAPGNQSLCLQQSRFEVTVDYRTAQGTSGNAKRVPYGSADSGLFWFFDPNNWEMLVKVIDACSFNGHFWVFAAATTDVEYTLTVKDTVTNEEVEYFNPLGTASQVITDTSALATCQ